MLPTTRLRARLLGLLAATGSLSPAVARADVTSAFTLGGLYTVALSKNDGNALGGEFTYVAYTKTTGSFGLGLFGQAQGYLGTGGSRFDLGPQINLDFFGLEAGWAYRSKEEGYSPSHGLHLGPFLSLGVASVAVRITVPLSKPGPGQPPDHGTTVDLALTLKWPFYDKDARGLDLPWHRYGPGGGRPLVAGKKVVVAALARGASRWSS